MDHHHRHQPSSLIDLHTIKAILLCSSLIYVGSLSTEATVGAHCIAAPLMWLLRDYLCPQLADTSFYPAWAATSMASLIICFQLEVVPYLEILVYENLTVTALAIGALVCAGYVRYHSPGRTLGPAMSIARVHFLRATLVPKTRACYCLGLVLSIVACVYGAQLSLTTICHPALFYSILLPDDCSDVYTDAYLSIAFSCAIYALMLALAQLWELIRQLFACCFSREIAFTELKASEC